MPGLIKLDLGGFSFPLLPLGDYTAVLVLLLPTPFGFKVYSLGFSAKS